MDAEQKTPDHIPNDVVEAILNHIPFVFIVTARSFHLPTVRVERK